MEALIWGGNYHEAGHAVAAYHHGMQITGVSATKKECMMNYRRLVRGDWSEAWSEAVVTMAGQLADERASGGEIRPWPFEEFLAYAQEEREMAKFVKNWPGDDHVSLLEALEKMASDPLSGDLKECYDEVIEDTRELIHDHWAEIEAVALALEENSGHLDGEEVVRLIEGATQHRR